jgi:hypothetical protein
MTTVTAHCGACGVKYIFCGDLRHMGRAMREAGWSYPEPIRCPEHAPTTKTTERGAPTATAQRT